VPREPRIWVPGVLYHVYSRGSDGRAICLDDRDFRSLQGLLLEAAEHAKTLIYAWALMSNHWHGLVRAPEAGLSGFLRRVNHRHSLGSNRRHRRRAHLFENRPGAVQQLTDEQLKWTIRYILRNPLEAGLARTVQSARWTSFRATVGRGPAPEVLAVDEVLGLFGEHAPEAARERFTAFVSEA
jgi:putative transposase